MGQDGMPSTMPSDWNNGRTSRWARWLALTLGPSLAALGEDVSIFAPVTDQGRAINELFGLIVIIAAGIFVIVEGLILYCLYRFRRPVSVQRSEPPQIYGSRPVEVAWTTVPLLIVFILFLVVLRSMGDMRPADPPADALKVRVIGRQWWWEYEYPELGIKTANELHLPIPDDGPPRPVLLDLESADVVHSYWVPRLGGKVDILPGRTNRLWFAPEKPGTYLGQCAEYCGTQHGNMLLRVTVDPTLDFDLWVANEKRNAERPTNEKGRKGEALFLSLACVNCHTARGTIAKGTAGPDLTHLASRETIGAGVLSMTRENLIRWVDDPQTVKPGCLMPSLHLDKEQVESVVDYLEQLR